MLKLFFALLLVGSPLSAQVVTTDTTPVRRIVSVRNGKADTSIIYSRPWQPNQRIRLELSNTLLNRAGDTITGQVYARDQRNVPITFPQFMWSLVNVAVFDGNTRPDGSITLIGRTGLYYDTLNVLGVEWTTPQGVFKDSIRIVTGLPQTAVLPPFTSIRLDTVNIYNDPRTGNLRAGILKVDSSPYFATAVDRIDTVYNRTPFRTWVHSNYTYAYSDSAYLAGGVVISPMSCPLKSGWDAPMWDIRWAPPLTSGDPNVVAPLKLAKAAVSQLPLDSLRYMAKVSMERYLKRDSTWVVGKYTYEECFGPLPP